MKINIKDYPGITLLLLICSCAFLGCQTSPESSFAGVWVAERNDASPVEIFEKDSMFYIDIYDHIEVLEPAGGGYHFTLNKQDFNLHVSEAPKELRINKRVFIPLNNSIRHQMLGTYHPQGEDQLFKSVTVVMFGSSFAWEIENKDGTTGMYYPRSTREGYTFSYGDAVLTFKVHKNCLQESDGSRYCK